MPDIKNPDKQSDKKPSFITRITNWCLHAWKYCSKEVWNDSSNTPRVKFVKVMNIAVSSFFDRGLQIKSMALTYSTVLALVPAIALLVAIGRGFGLQDSIQNELYILFPSQHKVISTFLTFVDSYLTSATQGVFVGVGILVLLWTVISLLSSIEDAFNSIWDVTNERTFFQKLTDYIAICLIIPVLLICSSGVSLFMTTTIQDALYFPFLSPLVNIILELAPLVLYWLAFSLSYYLIPHTKVNIKYAMAGGAIASVCFYILQWLFLNGQIYVSKYNAIYGSFSFLPLLLIWLQFSWLLLLTGCLLTYAFQNVMTFKVFGNAENLPINAWQRMAVIVMAIISQRFQRQEKPMDVTQLAADYSLPVRVVNKTVERLKEANLIYTVVDNDNNTGLVPAKEVNNLTVEGLLMMFDTTGNEYYSTDFNKIYAPLINMIDNRIKDRRSGLTDILLVSLPIPAPTTLIES